MFTNGYKKEFLSTRPRYESKADLSNEDKIRKIYEELGYTVIKLAPSHRIDFMLIMGSRATGVVEFKRRNCNHDTYSTFFISEEKFLAGLKMAEDIEGDFVIAVEWNDGMYDFYASHVDPHTLKRALGGRSDRGDPADREVMVHIPIHLFEMINKDEPEISAESVVTVEIEIDDDLVDRMVGGLKKRLFTPVVLPIPF